MNNCIKLISLTLVSALLITVAASVPAHAGTLAIDNKNCIKLIGFETKKGFTVNLYAVDPDCANDDVTTVRNCPNAIELSKQNGGDYNCVKYGGKTKGMAPGVADVYGYYDYNRE